MDPGDGKQGFVMGSWVALSVSAGAVGCIVTCSQWLLHTIISKTVLWLHVLTVHSLLLQLPQAWRSGSTFSCKTTFRCCLPCFGCF